MSSDLTLTKPISEEPYFKTAQLSRCIVGIKEFEIKLPQQSVMAVQCGVLFSYQIIHLIPPITDSYCETSRQEFHIYIATFMCHVGV